ncbi:MAG TPA: Nif3-like dinuclear metal center hexameric protein [Bacteroidales bacterium]|nr:Nif3-like dinuclear metal center hexameric protein [Bacteroidales bacterium]
MKKTLLILVLIIFCILPSNAQMTANKVISEILKQTSVKTIPGTVDVIKEGDPETQVKGIVTTMFATMEVLKKAVELNCNMIVVHEPLYYNHADNTESFRNDPVFLEKQKYIRDNKLVIWRFHDYIHSMEPDGILQGMVVKLGWKEYMINGDYSSFKLPETTLGGLLESLKKTFPKSTFYVIGNNDLKVKKVRFAPGAPGSSMHISFLEDNSVDVVIAGEAQQWETYEYTRDAVSQGRQKAVIFLGHIPSEEAGMEFCASWLKGFINGTPVHFIESGPSYRAF